MRDDLDELLKMTYHTGAHPTDNLNQTILHDVKEYENMKKSENKVKNLSKGYQGNIRKITKIAAAIAVILLAGSGVAYAASNYWGLDFFAKHSGKTGLNENVKKLVDNEPKVSFKEEQASKDLLNYKVSEVLCDSDYLAATIQISLKNEANYFIIPGPYDIDAKVSDACTDIKSDKTIEAYCKANNLTPIIINMDFDEETEKNIAEKTVSDCVSKNGKELNVMLGAKRIAKEKKFRANLIPSVFLIDDANGDSEYTDNTLQIDVVDNSTAESATYNLSANEQAKLKDTAIAIKAVQLTSTEIGTNLKVTYTSDVSSDDASLEFIELSDKTGTPLEYNRLIGEGNSKDNGDGTYTSTGYYESVGLPDVIYLSVAEGKQVVRLEKAK